MGQSAARAAATMAAAGESAVDVAVPGAEEVGGLVEALAVLARGCERGRGRRRGAGR